MKSSRSSAELARTPDPSFAGGQPKLVNGKVGSRYGFNREALLEVRIARSRSGYENRRGLVNREGEVGRVSGFCIERALRKHARLSVVGLAAISVNRLVFARAVLADAVS